MTEAAKSKPITELRALALRQGFLTEEQMLEEISAVPNVADQVELMDDAFVLMRELDLEVFESEEEARRRVKQVRATEEARTPTVKSLTAAQAVATTIRSACTCAKWARCRC